MPHTPLSSPCVRIHAHGGPQVMHIERCAVPAPAAGEVTVRHHAMGLNFIDIYQRDGLYPLPLPATLGMEGAGVVHATGEGVEHLHVGDRVAYACATPGSYAHYRTLPALSVCRLPERIGFEEGAAMMLKGLTVQYLLRRVRGALALQEGDAVLWHAAAGGVGLLACQWARALGLRLIATAGSDAKCALALQHGASHAINYRREDFAQRVRGITEGQGVKVVYDSVGKDTFEGSLNSLCRFGLLVSFGNASGPVPPVEPALLAAKGSLYLTRQTLFTHMSERATTQQMADELFAMVASGQVRIPVTQRFALSEVQQAHQAMQARSTTGCSVLLPEEF